MAAYHLAPCLVRLRSEINTLWPRRDKGSDGWIGDAAHGARVSDHNPDYSAGGVVRALDVDKDGIDVDALIRALQQDARVAYIIWNRRIWVRRGTWSTYSGANGHTAHVHVSIRHGSVFERSTSPWGLVSTVSAPTGGGSIAPRPAITTPTITLPEDDMTPDQDARLARIEAALQYPGQPYGYPAAISNQLVNAIDRLDNLATDVRTVRAAQQVPGQPFDYAPATHNAVARLIGDVAALQAAVAQVAAGNGADPAAIESAARAGAEAALKGITITVDSKG